MPAAPTTHTALTTHTAFTALPPPPPITTLTAHRAYLLVIP